MAGERDDKTPWWKADEGVVYRSVFARVEAIEQEQARIFDRFVKLAALYDRHERLGHGGDSIGPGGASVDALVSENVVKSNVDTFVAFTGSSRPVIRCMTDGAEWSLQRRARRFEAWLEGLFNAMQLYRLGPITAKAGGILGTGVLKMYPEVEDGKFTRKMITERTLIDEIVVDEAACRTSPPRELFQRRPVDREQLIEQFPEHEEAIRRAPSGGMWAGYRPYEKNQVMVIEGWYLGKKHVICIDGVDLLDEEWEHKWFPFIFFRFGERLTGFYGCGIAEDLAGHQRQINKLNWQNDRQLDMMANPFWLVQQADSQFGNKLVRNEAGRVVIYKATKPEQAKPSAVSPESYQRLRDLKDSSYQFVGNSLLSAQSKKPADVESGAAITALSDSETQRFAVQAQDYEQIFIDAAQLSINWAKTMGRLAPQVTVKATGRPTKVIDWAEVNLDDLPYEMSLQAASGLSRTPAGRLDAAMRLAQAGLIGPDEARRLLDHPDIQRAMSIANAAFEDIEAAIENMLDGEIETPEPYQFLDLGAVLVQKAYLDARRNGAPEDVLESLRTWIMQANHLRGVTDEQPGAGAAAAAGPMPMDPANAAMMPPPGAMPMPGIAAQPMHAM